MTEKELVNLIMFDWTMTGDRLWRNNIGQAWNGKTFRPKGRQTVSVCPRDLVIFDATPINFGLCVGSSDLIGFHRHVVMPEDVGRTLAIFSAIEVKRPVGPIKTTPEQEAFVKMVNSLGGFARVARSIEESHAK